MLMDKLKKYRQVPNYVSRKCFLIPQFRERSIDRIHESLTTFHQGCGTQNPLISIRQSENCDKTNSVPL